MGNRGAVSLEAYDRLDSGLFYPIAFLVIWNPRR
jgi:hypothetical protein